MTTDLGTGVLGWERHERQFGRYGTVLLVTTGGELVLFDHAPVGDRAHLVAVVLVTRHSNHHGDWDRNLSPRQPEVGDVYDFGIGTVFTEHLDGHPIGVGVRPDDGRELDWLDPHALYRCVGQTVRLELRDLDT